MLHGIYIHAAACSVKMGIVSVVHGGPKDVTDAYFTKSLETIPFGALSNCCPCRLTWSLGHRPVSPCRTLKAHIYKEIIVLSPNQSCME